MENLPRGQRSPPWFSPSCGGHPSTLLGGLLPPVMPAAVVAGVVLVDGHATIDWSSAPCQVLGEHHDDAAGAADIGEPVGI
ncbi:hypothetical protein, partial [Kocuria sabuli]|uniref:hypothetical protein n=1 Tax=Kocuria sabuli TaxID=3071448 RepID=UPI0034D41C22